MRFLKALRLRFLVVFSFPAVASQICQSLNPSLFQRCIDAGYNSTAYFPGNNSLHEKNTAKNLDRVVRQFEQCSEHSNFILCSIFVPKCIEGRNGPVLPCRNVCEEFARQCQDERGQGDRLEWIKGLCRLLPTKDDAAYSDKCFEPENYKPKYNATTPLTQTCTELSMSSCFDLGYNQTTQTRDSQMLLDNVLSSQLLRDFGNHTLCSPILKKIFCADFAPPCLPEDGIEIVIRTVCRSDCELLRRECPGLYKKHFGEHAYCEQMATDKSSDLRGYCELTKWPGADRWTTPSKEKVVPSLSLPSLSSSPTSPSAVPRPSRLDLTAPVPRSLRADASLPLVAILVSCVLGSVGIIAVLGAIAFLMRRKRCIAERWRVQGYRSHTNDWETRVSMKT